jgi:hypothetical protein
LSGSDPRINIAVSLKLKAADVIFRHVKSGKRSSVCGIEQILNFAIVTPFHDVKSN